MKKLNPLLKFFHIIIFLFITLNSRQLKAQVKDDKSPVLISGLQMNVSDDISLNLKQIMEGIRKAAAEGADFLVTPEGSLSGYTSEFDQKELAHALEAVTAEASKMKVGLMLGTCFKKVVNGKEFCYNQVRVYEQDGQFLGEYSKVLRCSTLDLPGSGEMVDYVEGELKTFDWNGYRFGVLICNDLWATPGYTTMTNPYLVWKLKQMGAQFIVHCINSGTAQKYRPFHESSAELWAMSVKLPILEVNAAQGDEKINAQSGLIDSNGERSLRVPDSGVQFFTVTLTPSLPSEKADKF
jgi:predicted amidohydrolase